MGEDPSKEVQTTRRRDDKQRQLRVGIHVVAAPHIAHTRSLGSKRSRYFGDGSIYYWSFVRH